MELVENTNAALPPTSEPSNELVPVSSQKKTFTSEEFRKLIEKLVHKYTKETFKNVLIEVTLGKKWIQKSRKKLVKRIIDGDKGRLRYDGKVKEKIKKFVRESLVK
jgi:hypothetical protein